MSSPIRSAYGAIKRKAEDSLEARMLKHRKPNQAMAISSVVRISDPISEKSVESGDTRSGQSKSFAPSPYAPHDRPSIQNSPTRPVWRPMAGAALSTKRTTSSRPSMNRLSTSSPMTAPPSTPSSTTSVTNRNKVVELLSDSDDDTKSKPGSMFSTRNRGTKPSDTDSVSTISARSLQQGSPKPLIKDHRRMEHESTARSLQQGSPKPPIKDHRRMEHESSSSLFLSDSEEGTSQPGRREPLRGISSSSSRMQPRVANGIGTTQQGGTSSEATQTARVEIQDNMHVNDDIADSTATLPPPSIEGQQGVPQAPESEEGSGSESSDAEDSDDDSHDETTNARKSLAYARQKLDVLKTRKAKSPEQSPAPQGAAISSPPRAPISMHRLYEHEGSGKMFGSTSKPGMQIMDFDTAARLVTPHRAPGSTRPRDAGELSQIRRQAATDAARIRATQSNSHNPQMLAAIKAQASRDAEQVRSGKRLEPINAGKFTSSSRTSETTSSPKSSNTSPDSSSDKAMSPDPEPINERDVTKDDWDLVYLRKRGSNWKNICQELGDSTRDETYYRRRYARMQLTFPSAVTPVETLVTQTQDPGEGSESVNGYAFPGYSQSEGLANSLQSSNKRRKITLEVTPLPRGKITDEDFYLVELVKGDLTWQQVQKLCEIRTKQQRHHDWYRKRYRRMHLTFPDEIPPSKDSIVFKRGRQPGPAHTEKDIMKTIAQPAVNHGDAEDSGIETVPLVKIPRPTTGGKTISPEMAHYFMQRSPSPAASEASTASPAPPEEPAELFDDVDKSHYVYEARRKIVPASYDGDPEDIEWVVITEKATENKALANLAGLNAQYQYNHVKPLYVTRWNISYNDDDLVSLVGTGDGGEVSIEATRKLQDYHEGIMPADPTGFMPRTVYEVFEKVCRTTTTSVLVEGEQENGEDDDVAGVDYVTEAMAQHGDEHDDDAESVREHEEPADAADTMNGHDELFGEPSEESTAQAKGAAGDNGGDDRDNHKNDMRRVEFSATTTNMETGSTSTLHGSAVTEESQAQAAQTTQSPEQYWTESIHVETSERLVYKDKIFTNLNIANGDARDYVYKVHRESDDCGICGKFRAHHHREKHLQVIAKELDEKLEKFTREETTMRDVKEGRTLCTVVYANGDKKEGLSREETEEMRQEGMLTRMETTRTIVEVEVRSRRIEGPRNP